ncbi:MAG: hypothetical protein IKE85_05980 [Mogibacterium sp.]|nr:hypothetical protein [Mogibacterium sp.]
MEFPTKDKFAKEVAEKALDEITYKGKTIREWIEIIVNQQWNPVSEGLPEDGTWNIWQSKTGAISIERYKEDAIDHFFPSGRFFELEDAIAWQPLPERYTESEE